MSVQLGLLTCFQDLEDAIATKEKSKTQPTVKKVRQICEHLSLSDNIRLLEFLLNKMATDPQLDKRSAAELKARQREIINTFIAQSLGIHVRSL